LGGSRDVTLFTISANCLLSVFAKNLHPRLEELKEGHLVNECYKETCSYDEALEAIESVSDTKVFWDIFTEPCKKLNPCG